MTRTEAMLLGIAVGDALGLPREGMRRRRAARWDRGRVRHGWLGRRGMVSDDTEHASLTVTALARSDGEPAAFSRELARGLRWWLAALPSSMGWATLRAGVKLWLGWSPARSGVDSAGNGAMIRAPAIALCARDPDHRRSLVRMSTRITHTDPRAENAAQVIAAAAAIAASDVALDARVLAQMPRDEPTAARVLDGVAAALDDPAHLATLGLRDGASGFAPHTLAAVLWAWLRHPAAPARAIEEVIQLGGDTDSTAALVGALAGIRHGTDAWPRAWVNGLLGWPRAPIWQHFPLALVHNVTFTTIAVGHVVRRWLPPY